MWIQPAVNSSLYKKIAVCVLLLLASACSTMSSTPRITADASSRWAILPVQNLSESAQADLQAQTLVETHLRSRGVSSIEIYTPVRQVSLRELLDPNVDMKHALEWAQRTGFQYGITGSVNEWQYKAGADREPTVGVSLKIIDVYTRNVLWQGNVSRTGWGYSSLPAVADDVIEELLKEVQLRTPKS